MPNVKEALGKLKWHEGRLADVVVAYTHRGAPGDTRRVRGADILELGASFFTVRAPEGETRIPYHRIQHIELDGAAYWQRRVPTLGELETAYRAVLPGRDDARRRG